MADNKKNLIYVSTRVHFVLHQLLTKIYPSNTKLLYAEKTGYKEEFYSDNPEIIKEREKTYMSLMFAGKKSNN